MSKPGLEPSHVETPGADNTCVKQPVDRHYVLLEGVAESVADETIRLYLMLVLNPSLDDNFKV
jgi:hypothetical protein